MSLLEHYGETHRYHHTMRHINEMSGLLMQIAKTNEIHDVLTMQLAIWYHDVIYDPTRGDNEELSAEMAFSNLYNEGFPIKVITDVCRLVLSTKNHEAHSFDEALLSDLDLAILGGNWNRYLVYSRGIRKEYTFVPQEVYIRERKKILQGFIDRPVIFQTEYFQAWDAPARVNMRREMRGWDLAVLNA